MQENINTQHNRKKTEGKAGIMLYKGICIWLSFALVCETVAVIAICRRQVLQIPYVVEINRDGEVKYVKDAISQLAGWKPSTATYIKELQDYITALRAVSPDRRIQESRIRKIYAFTTGNALKYAEQYLLETKPLDRLQRERCEIAVYAATPLMDEDLYQLDWNEKTYTLTDKLLEEKNYRAVLKIKHYTPRTESVQETNPLGIYVTDMKISEIKDGYIIYENN